MITEAWEQRPKETAQAFQAFSVYRDMAPSVRSLAKVGKQLGKSTTLMDRWSARHQWGERVLAWDSYLDKQAREEAVKEVREMSGRHTRLARAFLSKVAQRLVQVQNETLTAMEAIRWAEVAVKMERLACGLEESVIRVDMRQLQAEATRIAEQAGLAPDDVQEMVELAEKIATGRD